MSERTSVLPQQPATGLTAPYGTTGELQFPFPDADLMYIVDLLPDVERERYMEIRGFLQTRIRAQSIDFWNREEFPFGMLAEMGKYGLGGLQIDGTSKLFKGLMYVEVACGQLRSVSSESLPSVSGRRGCARRPA